MSVSYYHFLDKETLDRTMSSSETCKYRKHSHGDVYLCSATKNMEVCTREGDCSECDITKTVYYPADTTSDSTSTHIQSQLTRKITTVDVDEAKRLLTKWIGECYIEHDEVAMMHLRDCYCLLEDLPTYEVEVPISTITTES